MTARVEEHDHVNVNTRLGEACNASHVNKLTNTFQCHLYGRVLQV